MTHDPGRPAVADQRAVLATARAVLDGDPDTAHQAAASGSCPECTVICAVQLGFALAASLTGETFVSEPLRRQLLAAVDAAERELRAAPN